MPATVYDLTEESGSPIEQGATFSLQCTIYEDANQSIPKNLTGYTAKMQIRNDYSSATPLITLTEVDTLSNGCWIDMISGGAGTFIVKMAEPVTATFPPKFRGVYDLEIKKNAEVIKILRGNVYIVPEVTK